MEWRTDVEQMEWIKQITCEIGKVRVHAIRDKARAEIRAAIAAVARLAVPVHIVANRQRGDPLAESQK